MVEIVEIVEIVREIPPIFETKSLIFSPRNDLFNDFFVKYTEYKLTKVNINCLYNVNTAGELKYRFCPGDMLFNKLAISRKPGHKTKK